MTETIPAIQYLFLTHGKKPEPGKAIHHPAARLQVSNIRAFLSNDEIAKRMNFKSAGVAHDYVRNTSDFQQLAGLRSALSYVHHNTPAVVIMDDLTRLFRSTDYSESEALLDMLAPFGRCIFSIRHKVLLTSFLKSQNLRMFLMFHHDNKRWSYEKQTRRYDSAEDRKLQTSKASVASVAARKALSGRAYEVLLALKKEIEAERGTEISNAELARSANEKNLRNARGNPWTRQTVKRALDRNPTAAET